VGARIPETNKTPTTLVEATTSRALDGEFDPPPSPQGVRGVVIPKLLFIARSLRKNSAFAS